MNPAGRRKVIGIGKSRSDCSMMLNRVSMFSRFACAPIVEMQTTFTGRASSKACRGAATVARASVKSGTDGRRRKQHKEHRGPLKNAP
jgi:hypothetical protein